MKKTLKVQAYVLFDFDQTIYGGNSAVDFFISCVRKKPVLALYVLVQSYHLILYILRLKTKDEFKGGYFGFIRYIHDKKADYVDYFWSLNEKKIRQWYLDRPHHVNDVVVSASPFYYLEPLLERYCISLLIATQINDETGKIIGTNCYGDEKVRRIKELMPNARFSEAYSDSLSDSPMLSLAESAYIVRGDVLSRC